jgi:hypothetical protein
MGAHGHKREIGVTRSVKPRSVQTRSVRTRSVRTRHPAPLATAELARTSARAELATRGSSINGVLSQRDVTAAIAAAPFGESLMLTQPRRQRDGR